MLLPIDLVPLPLVLALLVLAGGVAKWLGRMGPPKTEVQRLLGWTPRLVRVGWWTFAIGFAFGFFLGLISTFDRFKKSSVLGWDPSFLYSVTLIVGITAAVIVGRALLLTARAHQKAKRSLASMFEPSLRAAPIRAIILALVVLLAGTFLPCSLAPYACTARGLVHEVAFGSGPWLARERSYVAAGGGGWGRSRKMVGPEPYEQTALRHRASRAAGIAHLYLWAIQGSELWEEGESRTARIAFLLNLLGKGGNGQQDLLLRWLRDENTATELRLAAAEALAELNVYVAAGDVARLASLRLSHDHPSFRQRYRERVTRAIWDLAHDDALPSLRVATLQSANSYTVGEVIRACMELDTPKAWELINELLRSSNRTVSSAATSRLTTCWREAPSRSLKALASVWPDSRDDELCRRLKELGLVEWTTPCHLPERVATLRSDFISLLNDPDRLSQVAHKPKTLDMERVCTSRATY